MTVTHALFWRQGSGFSGRDGNYAYGGPYMHTTFCLNDYVFLFLMHFYVE